MLPPDRGRMRSLLLLPGDDLRGLESAARSDADALVLDLAGSVAPDSKDRARQAVRAFLAARRTQTCFVRVNPLLSPWTDEDLAAVLPAAPDGIVLGRSEGGRDVQDLATRLAVWEARQDLPDGATRILAIAGETAASLFSMGSYRNCSRRLAGITWGAESLRDDLGAATTRDAADGLTGPHALARALTLAAARAAGVPAFDTLEPADGAARFERSCAAARRDGFAGKLALDTSQVATINRTFPALTAAQANRSGSIG